MSGFEFVTEDTVFVQGFPEDTTEEQLAKHFGQIGIIKFDKKNNCPKIWIYKDKVTGKVKGEATITYDDPPTATSAIDWFNGKEFRGSVLTVELAKRKSAPQFSRGGGRGGGGGGFNRGGGAGSRDGRGGGFDRGERGGRGDDRGRPGAGSGRPGDWLCPSCNNNNFAYRQECNRCRTQKPAGAGGSAEVGGGGGGSHYNGGRHHDDSHRGRGGSYGPRGARGGSNSRDNDGYRDRGGDRNRDRDRDRTDRDRDRDRHRDGRDRNQGAGYGGSGPSRSSHARDRDDRRSRPY